MFTFKIALQFLTRLPIKLSRMPREEEIASSLTWYSFVGALLGAILMGLAFLLDSLPVNILAAILLTGWVVMTGALHLDGFADTIDAWIGGYGDRERTLSLMKDPNSGPMAVVGLVLLLLLKYTCLVAILEHDKASFLVLAPWVARLMVSFIFLGSGYLREQGLGAALSGYRLSWARILFFVTQFIGLLLWLGSIALGVLIVGLIVFFIWKALTFERIGGFTGDTVGAQIELTEVCTLLFIVVSCCLP